jgi:phage gp29-like protein
VGEYPNGTSKADQDKLLASLSTIASEAGIIVPQGMVVKLLEAARSGSIDTYEQLARYMDEQISECVLGETLSTNIGSSGSLAAAKTHNEVRLELAKGDSDLLSDTLNETLIRWIVELNLPGANPPKLWREFAEVDDLKIRSEMDKNLVDMGFEPDLQYINETYGGKWTKKATPAQLQRAR